ncbi:hypothetical protein C5167_029688 [Papaver somniferum]|nr:hypothetical protein C5167_029688 [Papaver somniferum]
MSRDFSGGQKKRMQQPTGEILVGLENALFVISFSLIQRLPGVDPVTGQSTVGKALLKSKGLFRICVGHCLPFGMSKVLIGNEDDDDSKKSKNIRLQEITASFGHVNYYVDMPAESKSQGIQETQSPV